MILNVFTNLRSSMILQEGKKINGTQPMALLVAPAEKMNSLLESVCYAVCQVLIEHVVLMGLRIFRASAQGLLGLSESRAVYEWEQSASCCSPKHYKDIYVNLKGMG